MISSSDQNKPNVALICVHIPYASLRNSRSDHKPVVELIAAKTRTHIECNQLWHLSKIRFCIFGKWRDCLQAGRLLWYHLIRKTTIYAHSDWDRQLSQPMKDQNDKPFRNLYKSVSFNPLKEFHLISISGICWDVLKVRRELFKRTNAITKSIESQIKGNKTELLALQVLNYIRADINDDVHCPESIYSLRGSQLLHLITGFKNQTMAQPVCQLNRGTQSDSCPTISLGGFDRQKVKSSQLESKTFESCADTNSIEHKQTNKSAPIVCHNGFSNLSSDQNIEIDN